jgi:hypothetical protein
VAPRTKRACPRVCALRPLRRELAQRGTTLVLATVERQPLSLLQRSGFDQELGSGNIVSGLEALAGRSAAAPP